MSTAIVLGVTGLVGKALLDKLICAEYGGFSTHTRPRGTQASPLLELPVAPQTLLILEF